MVLWLQAKNTYNEPTKGNNTRVHWRAIYLLSLSLMEKILGIFIPKAKICWTWVAKNHMFTYAF